MAKPYGLVSRNGTWAIRMRVPSDLVAILKKREVGHSLRTQDKQLALVRFDLAKLTINQKFADERRKLQPVAARGAFEPSPDLIPYSTLTSEERRRIVLLWFHRIEKEAEEDDIRYLSDSRTHIPDRIDDIHGDISVLRSELLGLPYEGRDTGERTKKEALGLLKQHRISLDQESDDFKALRRIVANGLIESFLRSCKRLGNPEADETPEPLFFGTSSYGLPLGVSDDPIKKQPKISDVMEAYIRDKRPKKATVALYRRCIKWLIQVCGDMPIDRYNRDHMLKLREKLEASPSLRSSRLRGMTLDNAASLAADKKLKLRSAKSVVNVLSPVSTLFRYAVDNEIIQRNPAHNLLPKAKMPPKKRIPFETGDLIAIFNAPIFSGCQDDGHGFAKPGQSHPRRHRFWIPLIALYSGMRLNEICQLLTEDVQEVEGVLCILVREEDDSGQKVPNKSLKTIHSRRDVPVHHELLKIGFREFVLEQRAAGELRLFPGLSLTAHGTYSDSFQKWFRRYLATVGITHPQKSFHSFRHNFRDRLRVADVSTERVNAM